VTSPRSGRPLRGRPDGPTPQIDPHGEPSDVIDDVPELSVEEVEKRIGSRERGPRARRARTELVTREVIAPARRSLLWRDSATILAGVIIALLAARFLIPAGQPTATTSPAPFGTGVAVIPTGGPTAFGITPGPTLGAVVNPSLHLDATPTPIPVITLPPRTPKPSPTAPPKTAAPSHTAPPASQPPPSLPPPTAPPPAPIAGFSCPSIQVGVQTQFFDASTGVISKWTWNFGDSTGTSNALNPVHTYSAIGDYTVVLTVLGPGGSNTDSHVCSVT